MYMAVDCTLTNPPTHLATLDGYMNDAIQGLYDL
jgi:hypothetical protein